MSEKIHAAMIIVMGKIGAIGKDRSNVTQKYSFRGIDDVYNACHTIMQEAGIYCLPEVIESSQVERQAKSGSTLIYTKVRMSFTFVCSEDGSRVSMITEGEGMDSGDKSTNKAMSGAHKYALVMSLMIPTKEPKDSENDSPEVAEVEIPHETPKEAPSEPFEANSDTGADILSAQALMDKIGEAKAKQHLDNIKAKYAASFEALKQSDESWAYNSVMIKLGAFEKRLG